MSVPKQYRIRAANAAQLVESVEAGVADGALSPGQRLPSVRHLALELGLSPGTVAAGLGELRRRGVVQTELRRGTRIGSAPPIGGPRVPLPVPPGARDLSRGNPDPALLPDLGDALARAQAPARLYGEPAVSAELAALASRQLRADGIPGDSLCVVSGALDGIERVLEAHLRPGDRVAVENPGYAALYDLLRAHGLLLEEVGLDQRGMRPAELEQTLARGASAVVITPRGQNPTGALLDARRARELRAVLAGAPRTLVIEDDHLGLLAGSKLHTTVTGMQRWAATRSVSKALGPDLRLAVLAGDAQTVARVQGRQQCGPGWVSHILQSLALCLWSDARVRWLVRRANAIYAERRGELLRCLRAHGVSASGASGLNVWVPVADETLVVGALLQRGWVVAPGAPYRLAPSPPAVRVTIATLTAPEAERLAADLAGAIAPRPLGAQRVAIMTPVGTRPSTTIAPARRCAYTVLRRVFERGAYADRALRAEAGTLDRRDRALAARLSYGAVQRRGTLDHLIALLAARETSRLDAPVLAALRLGAYELLYLGGSPDYAIVADAVQLAKQHGRAGHGLVNAVLRRAAREGPALLTALSDETPEQAAIKHSHPEWIARLWWRELGAAQARALMAHDNEPAELALRANTLVIDAPGLAARLAGAPGEGLRGDGPPGEDRSRRRGNAGAVSCHLDPQIPEAVVLDSPFDVHGSALWRGGAFVAQSRAAMLVARALAPRAGERVLDLCAAPGGKTTHLAALMEGRGEVVAVERNRSRAAALARTARRLRAGNVRVEVGDAAIARPGGPGFDRVLVDPPCSGLGTLQARADLRWRATPAAAAEMSRLQGAILAAGARALRPGGVLVYSTCTISANENEHVIAAFLDSHRDFSLDDLAAELPAFAVPPPPSPRDRQRDRGAPAATPSRASSPPAAPGAVLTLPHRDRTAGFFIARLRRG